MPKKINVRVKENSTDVLYGKLLMYAEQLHQGNKRRIRNGFISLVIIPIILICVCVLTDSSRIVFLIVWIACMFVVAAFLMFIAYFDWQLKSILDELALDEEKELDSLITLKYTHKINDVIKKRTEAELKTTSEPVQQANSEAMVKTEAEVKK